MSDENKPEAVTATWEEQNGWSKWHCDVCGESDTWRQREAADGWWSAHKCRCGAARAENGAGLVDANPAAGFGSGQHRALYSQFASDSALSPTCTVTTSTPSFTVTGASDGTHWYSPSGAVPVNQVAGYWAVEPKPAEGAPCGNCDECGAQMHAGAVHVCPQYRDLLAGEGGPPASSSAPESQKTDDALAPAGLFDALEEVCVGCQRARPECDRDPAVCVGCDCPTGGDLTFDVYFATKPRPVTEAERAALQKSLAGEYLFCPVCGYRFKDTADKLSHYRAGCLPEAEATAARGRRRDVVLVATAAVLGGLLGAVPALVHWLGRAWM